MEQSVISLRALDAEVDAAAKAAPIEITTTIDRPEGEPTHRDANPFDERAFWVSEGCTVRVWSVRGVAVERVGVSGAGALRRRLPVPAFGSPELQTWLAKSDFFVLPTESSAPGTPSSSSDGPFPPSGAGLLFSRRRGEQPGGMFWLGALDRSSLPPITNRILSFEGAEAWTVGLRGKLTLVGWPRCSYRGHDFEIRGAWHDWKLILEMRPSGVWTYATLSEDLDFVGGDMLTWLETVAHGDALRAEQRLLIEIGFLLGRAGAGKRLAGELGLAEDPVRTGPGLASFEGERVWLRALTPPIGRPFAVVRCAEVEDALKVVDSALALGIPVPRGAGVRRPRVAIDSGSPQKEELWRALTARGCEAPFLGAVWWGDLQAGRK